MIWNPWREIARLRRRVQISEQSTYRSYLDAVGFMGEVERLNSALRTIAAEEKPTSNATVRRMAKMARESLGR